MVAALASPIVRIQSVHDTFHEAKHMFHAATRLGFHPVALLLLFRQRMASVAPFAYPVLHPIFFQRFLLTYIRAVRIRMVLDEYNSYTAFVEFQDESHDIVLVVGGACTGIPFPILRL